MASAPATTAVEQSLRGWVLVVNPSSAGGRTGQKWPNLLQTFKAVATAKRWRDVDDVDVVLTSKPTEATQLTRKALREGAAVVVAVGGDGSLSEVVQGFFEEGSHTKVSATAMVAHIPVGTGGDFRKSLQWTATYEEAVECLLKGTARPVDVGHVLIGAGTPVSVNRHFINVASCGSSALIARIANTSSKMFGSTIHFYLATVRGLLQYQPCGLSIRIDGGEWQEIDYVNCLAVCNGKYFGAGMMVAPDADISDGLLHVTVWAGFRVFEFVRLTPALYSGEHVAHAKTRTFTCKKLEVRPAGGKGQSPGGQAGDPVGVEADGETPGGLPAEFSVLPAALMLLA